MDRLGFTMQENLLYLMAYDTEAAKTIHTVVPLSMYDGAYRLVMESLYNYYRRYDVCPEDHLIDLCVILKSGHPKSIQDITDILESVLETRRSGGVNASFVMDQLGDFVRAQRLKSSILLAADTLQEGDLDKAEEALRKTLGESTITSFDPGTIFGTPDSLEFMIDDAEVVIPTGVKSLDVYKLGPTKKEMMLFIAPPKKGKSWWQVHLGKMALMSGYTVVHITLEMSEHRVIQRYVQALFSMSKHPSSFRSVKFSTNKFGQLVGFDIVERHDNKSLHDSGIYKWVAKQTKRIRPPLVVKEFPTGELTPQQLDAYLNTLGQQKGIVPDLLIVDYPDLMRIPTNTYRLELGNIYKALRGIAVKYNLALSVVSQSNRASVSDSTTTAEMVGEDYSKIATADSVLTYSQTQAEKAYGLARLSVDRSRNEMDGYTVVISQNYVFGQFCLRDVAMRQKYWNLIREYSDENE